MPGVSGETLETRCCIVGGGPAGMVLGFLLARAGVDVTVLEKHKDFLRDFRGDTVHPSTLQIMHELGLLDEFLRRPHQELRELSALIGKTEIKVADFAHVPAHCRFLALMPQWDFLDFLSAHAKHYRNFRLLMETDATGLVIENDRIAGVQAMTLQGPLTIRADLVVGADGRHSTVRSSAALVPDAFGVPIDVLWMRLPKSPADANEPLGRVTAGNILVTLDRGDYWQCALVIAKGGADALRSLGLDAFRKLIVRIAPMFAGRVQTLTDWDQIKLLTVTIDRLRQWCKPGLLCIGDAAHAMSPIGGVGINLAVQDAVAAANILAAKLRTGAPSLSDLYLVQRRRELPARIIQRIQMTIQDRVMTRVLRLQRDPEPPLILKLLNAIPLLRRIPARMVGIGFRPEHVRTAELAPP